MQPLKFGPVSPIIDIGAFGGDLVGPAVLERHALIYDIPQICATSPPLGFAGGELPVDEGLDDALVGEGVEQALDLVGRKVRGHALVLA